MWLEKPCGVFVCGWSTCTLVLEATEKRHSFSLISPLGLTPMHRKPPATAPTAIPAIVPLLLLATASRTLNGGVAVFNFLGVGPSYLGPLLCHYRGIFGPKFRPNPSLQWPSLPNAAGRFFLPVAFGSL